MAVYTILSSEILAELLGAYDVGALVSAKGIAEGVENSNYLVDTSRARYILTLYERRVDPADLPYFLGLMEHLATHGVPAPRPVADREGRVVRQVAGRPACLIEFLPGVSLMEPAPRHCEALGAALARMHIAGAGFAPRRANALGLAGWRPMLGRCLADADAIAPGLGDFMRSELADLERSWPGELPEGPIHADLFPDNVLFLDGRISGVIDFYFAANDMLAYDLAVCLNSWCFSDDGAAFHAERARALIDSYQRLRVLQAAERAALAVLCRGAAMRFLLTRSYDWLNTPPDALVTRKDPLAYRRRLEAWTRPDVAQVLASR